MFRHSDSLIRQYHLNSCIRYTFLCRQIAITLKTIIVEHRMRALVYTGPNTLEMATVPDPTPNDGEAIVAVEACGICGSDMHAFHGTDPRRLPPLVLGHEAAGTVLTGTMKGQRVTVNPMVTCGACIYCIEGRENLCPHRSLISIPPREGAFAERLAIPERNLIPVPDGIPLAHAALAEPLACGWHAIRLAAQSLVRPVSDVRLVVLGGGAIGLGAALVAQVFGVKDIWIMEPNDARRAMLGRVAPFRTCASEEDGPEPGDSSLIIDAYGSEQSRATSTRLAAPGGVIAHIGLAGGEAGLDTRRMTLQEITFFGTYTYTNADFAATAQAIFDHRLGDFGWVEERPLESGVQAFADLDAHKVEAAKIVLKM